jgi:hypothetical protein
MNSAKLVAALAMLCLGSGLSLQAQNKFLLTFRGKTYQTNSAGNVVVRPVTEQTWLQEAAQAGGATDTSGMAVIYHIAGNSGYGDTIEIADRRTGATLTTLMGFWFGDENDHGLQLGRTALTNSVGTETRRVDQLFIYYNGNLQTTTEGMGTAFVAKRFLSDRFGNLNGAVDAELNYLMLPAGTNTYRAFVGTFTTTKPFVPSP